MNTPLSSTTEIPFVNNTRDGAIVTLTLAQGQRYNPLSLAMIAALQKQLVARTVRSSDCGNLGCRDTSCNRKLGPNGRRRRNL